MKITSDWHIHSQNSYDAADMPIAAIIAQAAEKGITDFGITDHFNTMVNYPDIVASRKEFDTCNPGLRCHFGVEASVISEWEIPLIAAGDPRTNLYGIRLGGPADGPMAIPVTDEMAVEMGIEYIVCSVHWQLYVPEEPKALMDNFHQQYLFMAQHPRVDIIGHPWWWYGKWENPDGTYTGDPWFDDFSRIPQRMHDEFAAACVAGNTAVETSLSMVFSYRYPDKFKQQYLEYLAGLQQRGVKLAIGGDAHQSLAAIDYEKGAEILTAAGIRDDFWTLPPRKE
jgi:histidinol phosphatase-like PHP family hydrolase